MIWLNPVALIALAAVAAPILIHILVQRRAERFAFPTLRFLRPTPLAAIRRHVVEDALLLVVRATILAAAVTALAGPLMVTAGRREAWSRRVVRAVVVENGARRLRAEGASASLAEARGDGERAEAGSLQPSEPAFRAREFAGVSLSDGIRRAVAWLETTPPARRELVVVSPLPIGSITPADLASVPADVGIGFERNGTLPSTRTLPFGRLLTPGVTLDRQVTLMRDGTSVLDVPPAVATSNAGSWPIEVVASPADRPVAEAAVAAVLARRVWAPAPDRRARLVLLDAGPGPVGDRGPAVAQTFRSADAGPIRLPWMADAIARIARDPDLQDAAARVPDGTRDDVFTRAPWEAVAEAADGQPLAVAAGSPQGLIVVSAVPASDVATPILMRAIANALATIPDLQSAEVVPIAGEVLRAWSRPSAPPANPRAGAIDEDDRRWLWLAALGLLAIEMWIRRARRSDASVDEGKGLPRHSARSARRRVVARVA